ncbi:MAG: DUF4339 domain-containing protein [Planctomycetota bacterium]
MVLIAQSELFIQLMIMAVFAIACAAIATNRGRSGVVWFFIGLFFPCLGIILILALPDLKIEREKEEAMRRENRRLRERLRKERQVSDQRHRSTQERLDIHDEALGIDTTRANLPESEPAARVAPGAPPPPPSQTRQEWYYLNGDERIGPLALGALKELWSVGDVTPETLVWKDGLQDWLPIRRLPKLVGFLDG